MFVFKEKQSGSSRVIFHSIIVITSVPVKTILYHLSLLIVIQLTMVNLYYNYTDLTLVLLTSRVNQFLPSR